MNEEHSLFTFTDADWMARAIALAKTRVGYTAPNPAVGAVIVRDGQVLGEGCHRGAGLPHAEVEAFAACRESDFSRATLYVTLEPCSTFGRTPPCTELILAKKPQRVVIGCLDPNPKHAGRAIDLLRAAGIDVSVMTGETHQATTELIAPFARRITTGFPWITLKLGLTLDGRIADVMGTSQWITGESARALVQQLRLRVDAVLVGAETFRHDHPSLQPHLPNAPEKLRLVAMAQAGCLECACGAAQTLCIDYHHLPEELTRIASDYGVNHILCEGGGILAGALLDLGLVQDAYLFYAPCLLNDPQARSGFAGGSRMLGQKLQGQILETQRLGEDLLVHLALSASLSKGNVIH